jgi:transposase-like protein
MRLVSAMLKAIHSSEDLETARKKAEEVAEKLKGMKLEKAAEMVSRGARETFSYYAFPMEHWRLLRTNNPLERINREIRRRTRVVGSFPDGESALMLVAARLRHIASTKWGLHGHGAPLRSGAGKRGKEPRVEDECIACEGCTTLSEG